MYVPRDDSLTGFVRRRWKAIAICGVAFAVAGTVSLARTPKKYEASARIMVMRTEQRTGGIRISQDAPPELGRASNPVFTQVEMIRSRAFLRRAAENVHLPESSGARLKAEELADRLKVTPIKETDIIELSYRSSSATKAQRVLQSVVDTYLQEVQRLRREGIEAGLETLGDQVETARRRLAASERELLAFKRQAGTVSLPDEIQMQVRTLGTLEEGISTRKLDLEQVRGRVAALKAGLGGSTGAAVSAALNRNPKVRALTEQLLAAETSPVLHRGLGPDHPEVEAAQRRASALRDALQAEIKRTVGRSFPADEVDFAHQAEAEKLAEAQIEVAALSSGLRAAEVGRNEMKAGLSRYPEIEVKQAHLARDLSVNGQVYEQLLRRYEEARAALALGPSYSQVVSPPEAPSEPRSPFKGPMFPMVLGGAIAAAFGFGLLRDLLDRSVRPEELAATLSKGQFVATVPLLRNSDLRAGPLYAARDASTPYAEALRNIGILLEEHVAAKSGARVVGMTSTRPGEGKSVTVANLAHCLAETGYRVLVIDADPWRPRIHEIFGLQDASPGLLDTLTGKAPPEAIVRRSGGVHVIAAGRAPAGANPGRFRRRFAECLEAWRDDFDFILLDLPPASAFARTSHWARLADGLLFLTRFGGASVDKLGPALNQLEAALIPVIGVVAIHRPDRASEADYSLYANPGHGGAIKERNSHA